MVVGCGPPGPIVGPSLKWLQDKCTVYFPLFLKSFPMAFAIGNLSPNQSNALLTMRHRMGSNCSQGNHGSDAASPLSDAEPFGSPTKSEAERDERFGFPEEDDDAPRAGLFHSLEPGH